MNEMTQEQIYIKKDGNVEYKVKYDNNLLFLYKNNVEVKKIRFLDLFKE